MQKNEHRSYILPAVLILMVFLSSFFWFDPFHILSWENVRDYYAWLVNLEQRHPILTPFVFIMIYITYTMLSLPGIFLFSLMAGCLFSQPLSTIYVTCAATVGASCLFLFARTAFGKSIYGKANHVVSRMEHQLRKNTASYLLFLRLIPLSPFWIINISGAFFKVPLWTFIWTTFVGMIPSVIIYTQAGKELGSILQSASPISAHSLFNPYMTTVLLILAFIALLPILFKQLKEH